MKENKDLFGNVVVTNPLIRDKFIEPPFTLLDSKQSNWRKRMRLWSNLGIKGEIGRSVKSKNRLKAIDGKNPSLLSIGNNDKKGSFTSVFDPALCEVLYHWFCNKNDKILDCFAGGSVRGVVANYLGYKYTGIDIRKEQIDSNVEQGLDILEIDNQPNWILGDSNNVLDSINDNFDFIFSCPPYADLEVYSDLKDDISNKPYNEFMIAYESIIKKSCKLLKKGGYACFVVGEVRDKKGNYIGFVPDTIRAFEKCGMKFYNECILIDQLGTASMRANGNMKSKKLVKVHQNTLVFKKY